LSNNLHIKIQSLETCSVLNDSAIASGYAGRDPQGGTAMEDFK